MLPTHPSPFEHFKDGWRESGSDSELWAWKPYPSFMPRSVHPKREFCNWPDDSPNASVICIGNIRSLGRDRAEGISGTYRPPKEDGRQDSFPGDDCTHCSRWSKPSDLQATRRIFSPP